MSPAESPQSLGFEVVIADDGGIPAEQLHGLRPGTHLRVVPDTEEASESRRRLEGALIGKINVEALEEGLRWAKEQRIADIERSGS